MFAKFAISVVALAICTSANPVPQQPSNSCSTGQQTCCNKVVKHDDPLVETAKSQSGILDFDIKKVLGDVGIDCTLNTLLPVCQQTVVCCQNVTFNSLIAFGCSSLL